MSNYWRTPYEQCPDCYTLRNEVVPFVPVKLGSDQVLWLCKNWESCRFPYSGGDYEVSRHIVPRSYVDPFLLNEIVVSSDDKFASATASLCSNFDTAPVEAAVVHLDTSFDSPDVDHHVTNEIFANDAEFNQNSIEISNEIIRHESVNHLPNEIPCTPLVSGSTSDDWLSFTELDFSYSDKTDDLLDFETSFVSNVLSNNEENPSMSSMPTTLPGVMSNVRNNTNQLSSTALNSDLKNMSPSVIPKPSQLLGQNRKRPFTATDCQHPDQSAYQCYADDNKKSDHFSIETALRQIVADPSSLYKRSKSNVLNPALPQRNIARCSNVTSIIMKSIAVTKSSKPSATLNSTDGMLQARATSKGELIAGSLSSSTLFSYNPKLIRSSKSTVAQSTPFPVSSITSKKLQKMLSDNRRCSAKNVSGS